VCVCIIQYCSVVKLEKSEMGGTRSAYGGEGKRVQGFGLGNLREGDQL
jgi:hypothetical protein